MKRKGGPRKYLQQNFDLYLLLLPALIYVFIFHLLPMVGILIAFKDYNMFQVPGDPFRSILESPWAGFKYFEQVFKKSEYLHVPAADYLRRVLKRSAQHEIPKGLAAHRLFAALPFLGRHLRHFRFVPRFYRRHQLCYHITWVRAGQLSDG